MTEGILDVLQIVFADIILSGDNALVIGMAAAGLPPELRKKAIFFGMALAAGLRIFFAIIASLLLKIPGILFFGGLLLALVCWRFYNDLRRESAAPTSGRMEISESQGSPTRQLSNALITITFADVSMSIDNVVAVAAIARENTQLLVFGLVLAIIFMAFFATIIMKIMTRFKWLPWLGLFFLIYLTLAMLYDGWPQAASLVMNIWAGA
ncbi:MAG: YjbE family putative metal transport protein [Albidovulum sp.]|nr:YjbE family putative metal transport protein [Albidovulum sp.]MDE0307688.1 YjbE family putative metal transport protein [Albidovulum sp.]MDE0532137.1 YjbE family putative metal transport protein [Albidovulum sp.]